MTCRISTDDDRIGALLRHYRKRKGIPQDELGQAIGITGSQISRYERGQEFCPLVRRAALAEALGLDPQVFAEPSLMEVTAEERAHIVALRAGRRSSFVGGPVAIPLQREAASC